MKYKLLKDYPPYKKGTILEHNHNYHYMSYMDSESDDERTLINEDTVENTPNWFAPYVFTTEDDVDIYSGENYYLISYQNTIDKFWVTSKEDLRSDAKRFSTRETAEKYVKSKEVPEWVICIKKPDTWTKTKVGDVFQTRYHNKENYNIILDAGGQNVTGKDLSCFKEATKAEVEAHKLGFHIGDKVWLDTKYLSTYLGIVESFSYSKANILKAYVAVTKASKGHDYSFMDITNKEPIPKIITEEGDKLYGDDKCILIFPYCPATFEKSNYIGSEKDDPESKYFSKTGNAKQYFAELQAEKRGIKIGIDIFSYPEKVYQGQVHFVGYSNIDGVIIKLNKNDKNFYRIEDTIYVTSEELVKEEGKKRLDENLKHLEIEGSDLDIDKTCETCKYYEDNSTAICHKCSKNFHNQWEPKELRFEVGKWYTNKSGSESFCCTKIKGEKIYGYGMNAGNVWQNHAYFANINNTRWELAAMKEVEKRLLTEAKKRYPIGTNFYNKSNLKFQVVPDFTAKVEIGTHHTLIWYKGNLLFEDGEWAEIVKEPELMLGKVEARIVLKGTSHPSKKYHNIDVVWTEKGVVPIEDWVKWYDEARRFYFIAKTGEIGLKLGEYSTLSVKNGLTKIGCIKNITWEQLKAVTKAIKKL